MRPVFHMGGMMAVLITLLNRLELKVRALGPKCFSMSGDKLSGPVDLEFFVAFRTSCSSFTWKIKDYSAEGGL